MAAAASLAWAARASATLTCDSSTWTDDRSQAATITFPNSNQSYSPTSILINSGQTVYWDGTSGATFSQYPLVSSLWGTFSRSVTSWPFTYGQAGAWGYHNGNDQTMEGIVCVEAPPVVSFAHSPAPANPNQTVTFDGSASHAAASFASITDYQWDLGSGLFTDNGTTPTISHAFSKAGIYKIRLKVTDNLGTSSIHTEQVTIGSAISQAPKLTSTTIKDTSGMAPLSVENPNGLAANGRATLTESTSSGPVQIGMASFTDPAHGTVKVSVPLSRRAKKYLRHHRSLTAKATIVLSGNGTSKTGVWTITIKARHHRRT